MDISLRLLTLHKSRLRNFFLFYLNDSLFWDELEKFFYPNSLNFNYEFIYEKNSALNTSLISILLLEMYLFEFDRFILNLSFKCSSFKTILSLFNFKNDNFSFFMKYSPLCFERFLYNLGNFDLLAYKKHSFSRLKLLDSFSLIYSRHFSAIRYKDHLLLGFSSSRKFALNIKDKLISFLRSTLAFDLKNFNLYDSSQSFYFIGFYISTNFSKKSFVHNKVFYSVGKLGFSRISCEIFSRVNLFKRKFFSNFLDRIRYELITNFVRKKHLSNVFLRSKLDYKFWSYFFQLECLRSFNYFVLILSDDLIFTDNLNI